MVELSPSAIPGTAQIGVAGDVLNTAIYLRRSLPVNHSVSFVSLLGVDQISEDMVKFIASQGLEVDRLGRLPGYLPGVYAITTDNSGERSFHYWRENSAARQMFQRGDEDRFAVLDGLDVIYLSGITLAILPAATRCTLLERIKAFTQTGGKFVFDSNYRPNLWECAEVARKTVQSAWKICDIALPSVDDEMSLFEETTEAEVLDRFSSYQNCFGALKRGALGPFSINKNCAEVTFDRASDVVDTTAAGDGFNGGYLAAILRGSTQENALTKGHELACRIVMHKGAILPVNADRPNADGV